MKFKLTWKIWLWLIILGLALISIFITPNFMQKGVLISSVEVNSTAFEQGLRQGQLITSVNGQTITNLEDYSNAIKDNFPSTEKIKTTIITKEAEYILYSTNAPDIIVSNLPLTNLQLGLDLAGGSRAVVEAKDHKLTKAELTDLASIVENRFNVFGISDVKVTPKTDLSGNNRLTIEIAGATPKDLEKLISQQGKFEAKIGNDTVFIGGERDIASVSRSGQESRISCPAGQDGTNGYYCTFEFAVYLSEESAERHAEITKNLEVNSTSQGNYLSKKLDLYLDEKLVDSLLISEGLKGVVTTQISISGSGSGSTLEEAYDTAQANMEELQTILITGSLPFQLEIVKLDTISPSLGASFARYILLAGLVALLLIVLIIFIRYRAKSAIAPLIICTSEIIITLGIAALIKWDLDLPSIAGILAAIGTGVDDQIVVLDETRHKEEALSMKQKIKRAFAIILGAYLTVLVSLLPLLGVGTGLLTGFVFTTVIGITIGVLITRPAFADIVKIIEK